MHPVSVKSSKPSFFILCPRSFNCLFLIRSVRFVSIFLNISSFFLCSVHGIHTILLSRHISVALKTHLHLWPYKWNDITRKLSSVSPFFLFLNTLLNFWKAYFCIIMRLQILVSHSFVKTYPRYLHFCNSLIASLISNSHFRLVLLLTTIYSYPWYLDFVS